MMSNHDAVAVLGTCMILGTWGTAVLAVCLAEITSQARTLRSLSAFLDGPSCARCGCPLAPAVGPVGILCYECESSIADAGVAAAVDAMLRPWSTIRSSLDLGPAPLTGDGFRYGWARLAQ